MNQAKQPSFLVTPLHTLFALSLSRSFSHPLLSSSFNQTSQLPLHPNSISPVLQTISPAVLPSSSSSSSMSFSPSNMSCIPYCYNQSFHYYAELLTAISCSAPFSLLMPVSVATPSDILLKVNVGFCSLKPAPDRSRWPHDLRRGSAALRLLGFRVRILSGAWISVCCECC